MPPTTTAGPPIGGRSRRADRRRRARPPRSGARGWPRIRRCAPSCRQRAAGHRRRSGAFAPVPRAAAVRRTGGGSEGPGGTRQLSGRGHRSPAPPLPTRPPPCRGEAPPCDGPRRGRRCWPHDPGGLIVRRTCSGHRREFVRSVRGTLGGRHRPLRLSCHAGGPSRPCAPRRRRAARRRGTPRV